MSPTRIARRPSPIASIKAFTVPPPPTAGGLELREQPLDVPAIMPSKNAVGGPGSE